MHKIILIASDIHESYHNVQRLVEREKSTKFDFVFLLGDFLNLNHEDQNEDESKYENLINDLLTPFKQLSDKIYMIPGNHDPNTLFNGKQFINGITNIEGQIVQLDDLTIYGLGGSIPGYMNEQEYWSGYPYLNDQEFTLKFNPPKINNLILLTHIGPSISHTTIEIEEGTHPILSGSPILSEFISKNKLVFHSHGHTHSGVGSQYYKGNRIINPGPLLYGNYAIVTIEKQNEEWKLVEFKHILL